MTNKWFCIAGVMAAAVAMSWAPALNEGVAHAQYQAGAPSQQTIDNVSAGISQIQQTIANIQQANQTNYAPSQQTLDYIQAQVNSIRIQKDQIAIQVAQIVSERAAVVTIDGQTGFDRVSQALTIIQQETQVIAQEMASSQIAVVTPAQQPNSSVESQISAIKQKIASLTQQEQALGGNQAGTSSGLQGRVTQTQTSRNAAAAVSCDAATGTCQATSSGEQAAIPPVQTAPQQKSFWQSIVDFVRNLFTF
jgi:hypothetical protein